jgi:PCI domain
MSQFLESYKSVKLGSMAAAFGVGPNFMDQELAGFIAAGRLPAKIDKVAGVVETSRYRRNIPTTWHRWQSGAPSHADRNKMSAFISVYGYIWYALPLVTLQLLPCNTGWT